MVATAATARPIRTTATEIRLSQTVSEWQSRFLECEADDAAVFAGRGSGKSRVMAEWKLQRRLTYHQTIGLCGASTHQQTRNTIMKYFLSALNRYGIPYDRDCRPKHPVVARRLEEMGLSDFRGCVTLPNGSVELFRSLGDQAYDALRGYEFADIGFDESRELAYQCFETLAPCLRGYGNISYQFRRITTPNGFDWNHQVSVDEFHDRHIDGSEYFHATSRDNPFNPPGYVDSMLARLSARMAQQEIEAQFVSIAGAVWPELLNRAYPDGNLLEWEFDELANTYASIDFGYRSPAIIVVQEIRPHIAMAKGIVDREGKPIRDADIVVGEWLPENTRLDEIVQWLLDWQKGKNCWGRPIEFTWCSYDPAGDNVNQDSGKKPAEVMAKAGLRMNRMPSAAKWRTISYGCELVASRFCNAQNERRLFLACRDVDEAQKRRTTIAPGAMARFMSYSYPESKDDKPLDERPEKGGIGAPDHAADALRYFTVTRRGREAASSARN